MKIEEALNVVRKVCAEFRGTLGDHQVLQQALEVITNAAVPMPVKEEEGVESIEG